MINMSGHQADQEPAENLLILTNNTLDSKDSSGQKEACNSWEERYALLTKISKV